MDKKNKEELVDSATNHSITEPYLSGYINTYSYEHLNTNNEPTTESFSIHTKLSKPKEYFKNKFEISELESHSEEMLDIVSYNVKKYRKLRGFTQIELSLEIGLKGGAYLGRAELRKPNHHFNIKHIAKIAKVLEVDIHNFFEPDFEFYLERSPSYYPKIDE